MLAWSPAPFDTSDARGRVIDARTAAPLQSAIIEVEPGRRRVSTDSLGTFRLPDLPTGRYHIRVHRFGFVEARDSGTYGMGGLRLLAALSPMQSLVDYMCIVPGP